MSTSIEEMHESLNVFDEPLDTCGEDPMTGFFRDGCCNTSDLDVGSHTVCVEVTTTFLEFSRFRGQRFVNASAGVRICRLEGRRPLVSVRGAVAGGAPVRRRPKGTSAPYPPARPGSRTARNSAAIRCGPELGPVRLTVAH